MDDNFYHNEIHSKKNIPICKVCDFRFLSWVLIVELNIWFVNCKQMKHFTISIISYVESNPRGEESCAGVMKEEQETIENKR